MNELAALIDLLKTAVDKGQTFTITADDIMIKSGPSADGMVGQATFEVTINAPSISTEA